jgi:magnesium-protoporphyrin O-methyltransferase
MKGLVSGCCATRAIADQFGRQTAQEELRRYRSDGPLPTTRALVDALASQGMAGADVLDVGAGVGAIHQALLERGASRAVHVDISPDYVDAARDESARRGQTDRVRFVTGDFVELASKTEAADVVTLDRVICCYPDMERLVTRSAEKARRLYGAVYPRDRWWTRISIVAMNGMKRLRGSAFRTYLHSPAAIDALLRRLGLERRSTQRTWFWEVVVYRRAP